jgi:hypothetical protein
MLSAKAFEEKINKTINKAINKANKQLGRIKHSFKYLNEKTTILLYKSHILSKGLYYGVLSEKVKLRVSKKYNIEQQK